MDTTKEHIYYSRPYRSDQDHIQASKEYFNQLNERRSVRDFSDRDVPREVIESIIKTAASAPSGAHQQPWTFCVIRSSELKSKIREAAEQEEKISYQSRMSEEWLEALKPIGTDWNKPFLEIAPWIIIVFKQAFSYDVDGNKVKHYYVNESVGIATGFLISAIHQAGLVTLTHTPSPMNFLHQILERPDNERPFMLLPVGHPHPDAKVPDFTRKTLKEMAVFYE